jgi:phosphoserine phosphatase
MFFSVFYYFQFFSFCGCPKQLHYSVFNKFLKGRKRDDIFYFAEEFINKNICQKYYAPAIERLEEARKNNSYLLLLSSSPDEITSIFSKKLAFHSYKSTQYLVDKQNIFTDISFLMDGEAKASFALSKAKELKISENNIDVYTDSFWDLPLLEIAGKSICVNPDRKLKKIAKQRGWEII